MAKMPLSEVCDGNEPNTKSTPPFTQSVCYYLTHIILWHLHKAEKQRGLSNNKTIQPSNVLM